MPSTHKTSETILTILQIGGIGYREKSFGHSFTP